MKKLLLSLEPLIWLLFGQGILIGTMLLTGWVLVVGVAAPLGVVAPLDFARAHALGATLLGRLVLFALVALPLWKGAHHLRHALIDLGGGDRDAQMAPLLYAVAGLGSLAALAAVLRL
jgi:fumarate reductase subunit D